MTSRNLIQLMRLWYLSHRQTAKAQARLRIRAVSPEPSLFAHIKYRSRRRIWPKIRRVAQSGLLRMRVWRLSLRSAISAIISWVGSFMLLFAIPSTGWHQVLNSPLYDFLLQGFVTLCFVRCYVWPVLSDVFYLSSLSRHRDSYLIL